MAKKYKLKSKTTKNTGEKLTNGGQMARLSPNEHKNKTNQRNTRPTHTYTHRKSANTHTDTHMSARLAIKSHSSGIKCTTKCSQHREMASGNWNWKRKTGKLGSGRWKLRGDHLPQKVKDTQPMLCQPTPMLCHIHTLTQKQACGNREIWLSWNRIFSVCV